MYCIRTEVIRTRYIPMSQTILCLARPDDIILYHRHSTGHIFRDTDTIRIMKYIIEMYNWGCISGDCELGRLQFPIALNPYSL